VRGTGIRVQTLAIAARQWDWTSPRIAAEYDLSETQVKDALAFYDAHHVEIDAIVAAEATAEQMRGEQLVGEIT
jgi:uncharacterized protein (DUF433 family)